MSRFPVFKIILAVLLLIPACAFASTGGPDGGGYTFIDSGEASGPVYAFEDIADISNSLNMTSDDNAKLADMGFDFNFYGVIYNSVYVSSNGHMDFTPGWGNGNYNINNLPIPQPSAFVSDSDNGWGVNPLILPFFDDLDPVTAGDVYVDVRGTAPDRRFIVQWDGIPHFDCNLPVDSNHNLTFQAILYETSNELLFQYKDVSTGDILTVCQNIDGGGSATVGLDFNQRVGLEYSSNSPALSNGLAILFKPGPDPNIVNSASTIDFGDVIIGSSSAALLTLSNAGGSLLQIDNTSAVLNSPFSTVSDNCTGNGVPTAEYCSLTVMFEPSGGGAFSNTLVINSNDPDDSPLNISVIGNGVASLSSADISVSDSVLPSNDLQADFGSNLISSRKDVVFTVTNQGGGPLHMGSVDWPDSFFTNSSDGCSLKTLQPGTGSCQIVISFSAPVAGTFQSTFVINSDDPDEPAVSVYVTGTSYNTAPSQPQLISPENLATDQPSDVTFSWNRSFDPDPGDTVTYKLYYTDDADWQVYGFSNSAPIGPIAGLGSSKGVAYASMIYTAPGILMILAFGFIAPLGRRRKVIAAISLAILMVMVLAACGGGLPEQPPSYEVTGLSPGTTYHWKVVATDSYGQSTDSVTWSFTTAP